MIIAGVITAMSLSALHEMKRLIEQLFPLPGFMQVFNSVDDVLAGIEGRTAMRRADGDQQDVIPHSKGTRSMHDGNFPHVKLLQSLKFHFLQARFHGRIFNFKCQTSAALAFEEAAYRAQIGNHRSDIRASEGIDDLFGSDFATGYLYHWSVTILKKEWWGGAVLRPTTLQLLTIWGT